MRPGQSTLVSIIMPTYNRASYILETIRSIQSQTYENWELIVVDDGSNDDTQQLIDGLCDERIVFKKYPHTGIIGRLKNQGIRKAKGELIAFMDSDDLWPAEKLEKQILALAEFPDVGYVLTNGYNFHEAAHKPLEMYYPVTNGMKIDNFFIPFCLGRIAGYTQALMLRRGCIDKVGYFSENRLYTDLSFIGTLAYHYKGLLLYELLFMRRLHASNLTAAGNSYLNSEYFETISIFKKNGMLQASVANEGMFKVCIHTGERRLSNKRKITAIRFFFRAWRYKPFSIIPLKKIGKAFLARF